MGTQPSFEEFKPVELQVPPSRPKSVKGFPFKLKRRMVQELKSYAKGFGNPMTQTSTPKSMGEVAAKAMKVDKVVDLV